MLDTLGLWRIGMLNLTVSIVNSCVDDNMEVGFSRHRAQEQRQ